MEISQTTSIVFVIIASGMWGSWFQFVRRIGEWSVSAFMLCLYSMSFLVITPAVLILKKWFIPEGIINTIIAKPKICLLVFVCGGLFAIGMQIHMMVVNKAGLIFSTSITSVISIPMGFFISAIFGGIREDVSLFLVILGVAVLLSATLLCQKAIRMRDIDQGKKVEKGGKTKLKYVFMLLLVMFFFSPSYTLAMSLGTQTSMNTDGIPPVLLVGILCAGSFVGTWIFSGIRLTRAKQWKEAFSKSNMRYIIYGCTSGLFHYGGNMIHTIAIPALSAAIAWPMGQMASFWQYLWGIGQGEFKAAKKKTIAVLACGMMSYITALVILSSALFW
jgi:hypothetical protein